MSSRPSSLAAALLFIGLLGACSLPGDDDDASGGLVGTSWTVTEIGGTTTLEAVRPTMAFAEDGTLSGTDGCNRYTARFRTEGDGFSLTEMQQTDMACEPIVMAQADAFRQALLAAGRWRLSETGSLELGARRDLVAEPFAIDPQPGDAAAPNELIDTAWRLIDLGGSRDLLGVVPTLEFMDPEGLGGFAGCNTYTGSYVVSGMDIDIGPLATTRMACGSPASDIETAYIQALDAAGLWSIDDAGHLVLAGPTTLVFEPA